MVREPAALVLHSSGHCLAQLAWGYGVPPFVSTNPFDTGAVLRETKMPVLISHGDADTIFPLLYAQQNAKDAGARGTVGGLTRAAAIHATWGWKFWKPF